MAAIDRRPMAPFRGIARSVLWPCLLALLIAAASLAGARADPPIPPLTGRVVDDAHVLGASTIDRLTTRLQNYEAATTNQVVVVTLPDLKGYPIEDWGLALGRGWGIGQKGKDNGVLLIVAPNDRQLRIEVGYGLEGQLPDATADKIIRYEIVPRFKGGDLEGGVDAGVVAILAALGGSYSPSAIATQDDGVGVMIGQYAGPIFLVLFLVVFVVSHIRRKYDPTRRRNVFYWYDDPGSRSGGGFSSGGFSSHSSGGFSGGGGSFGGGGASGRW
ncbi:MAG TPA: TPM domain-containing protein [Dongiaceae bacterium]|jgi:uncharacterized protein|nr:TPM domain-containing protein [Dongiaceae bacterium]